MIDKLPREDFLQTWVGEHGENDGVHVCCFGFDWWRAVRPTKLGEPQRLVHVQPVEDAFIREKLRAGQPPWRVEEFTVKDLALGEALVRRLVAD